MPQAAKCARLFRVREQQERQVRRTLALAVARHLPDPEPDLQASCQHELEKPRLVDFPGIRRSCSRSWRSPYVDHEAYDGRIRHFLPVLLVARTRSASLCARAVGRANTGDAGAGPARAPMPRGPSSPLRRACPASDRPSGPPESSLHGGPWLKDVLGVR